MTGLFDPTDPAFVQDPYPLFASLRENDPVHRSPTGAWVLTRYEDIRAALVDPRLGNAPARYAVVHERNRDRYVCADVANNILPFMDPPRHSGPRRIIGRAFAERMKGSPPRIPEFAQGILDRWRQHRECDVISDFASPLAVAVIADVLGVPRADAPKLERWSETFFYLFMAIPSAAVRDELDATLTAFREYLTHLVAARRRAPTDDLISALLAAQSGAHERSVGSGTGPSATPSPNPGASLSDAELIDNCMLLFADGVENVDRAIGNAAHALLTHPDQLAKLRADPDRLIGPAVEECLRYESPAQYIGRITREPIAVHGHEIPAGAMVLLVLGSANRDPDVFSQPDHFEVRRAPNPHLAFGSGSHSCVGGPLVTVQMKAALHALILRYPSLRTSTDEVAWIPRPGHRWIESLRVRWEG